MLNFLFTSRNVGVRSNPPKNSRIGIVWPWQGRTDYEYLNPMWGHKKEENVLPRTAALSMISNFVIVSLSVY